MNDRMLTLQAHLFAVELFSQGNVVNTLFEEMEEIWLSLYTKDKTCPIVEQVGTFVKRKLVKEYAIHFIRRVRGIYGLTLATKNNDPDAMFWVADDIVQRIADGQTESHDALFKSLFNALFGISIDILNFFSKPEKTKEDVYTLVGKYFPIDVVDRELDDVITEKEIKAIAKGYLDDANAPVLFTVPDYS